MGPAHLFKRALNKLGLALEDVEQLTRAVKAGNLKKIIKLAERGVDLKNVVLDERGNTAAHYAAMHGRAEIFDFLAEHDAINTCNQRGQTPLDFAEKNKRPQQELEALTSYGAVSSKRLLMDAAKLGDLKKIEKLAERGVNLNAVDEHGNTAAHYAAMHGRAEIFDFLAKHDAINTCNQRGQTPLDFAEKYNRPQQELKVLISYGAVSSKQLLIKAVRSGDVEKIRELAERGVDLNAVLDVHGNTAAHYAAEREDVEHEDQEREDAKIIDFLAEHNAINNCNGWGQTPLDRALYLKCGKARDCLSENGAVSSAQLLAEAVWSDDVEKIRELAERGVDLNVVLDKYGNTAAHYAAYKENTEILAFLVEHDAISTCNGRGMTPLDTVSNHSKSQDCLIKNGAFFSWQLIAKLGEAVWSGDVEKIRELAERRVDLKNVVLDERGNTAAHYAAYKENAEMLNFLAEHDAISTCNGLGLTPLDIAKKFISRPEWETLAEIKAASPTINELMDAAKEGNLKKIEELARRRIDLNAVDRKGNTAAHYAAEDEKGDAVAEREKTKILRFLATHNAINNCNQDGRTPLDIYNGPQQERDALISMNAVSSVQLITELMTAAWLGEVERIKQLSKQRVDLKATDAIGNTAAHYATEVERIEVLRFLAAHNAINTCNLLRQAPLDIAKDSNYVGSGVFLISNGAISMELTQAVERKDFATIDKVVGEIEELGRKDENFNIKPLIEQYSQLLEFTILQQDHEATQALLKINADMLKAPNDVGDNLQNMAQTIDPPEERDRKNILMLRYALADHNYEVIQVLIEMIAEESNTLENFNKSQQNAAESTALTLEYLEKLNEISFAIISAGEKHADGSDNDIKEVYRLIKECASTFNVSKSIISEKLEKITQKTETPINWHLKTLSLLRLAIKQKNEKAIAPLLAICKKYQFNQEEREYFFDGRKDKDLQLLKFIASNKSYRLAPTLFRGMQRNNFNSVEETQRKSSRKPSHSGCRR